MTARLVGPRRRGNFITSGRKPSAIFHEHVGATFMRDRTAILNRELIGRDNIMWGSDYPHFDGAWPDSAGDLESQFEGVSLDDQKRIGRTNAIAFLRSAADRLAPAPRGCSAL